MESRDPSPDDEHRSISGTQARIPTILLVEDNDDERDLYQSELTRAGFRVLAAASAEAALSLMVAHRIDALLTDHHLPWSSGATLIERAREEGLLAPGTVTFICTGQRRMVAPEGVVLLHKPIAPEDVAALVAYALSLGSTAANG